MNKVAFEHRGWPEQAMKGGTANAKVRHRFNQSGDADATGDLGDDFGPLRHFNDDIGRESGLMATANQFIVENRIRVARRQYPVFVS